MKKQFGIVPGDLDIKIIDAKLTRDTEFFGKMSPFVQIEIGGDVK